MRVSAIVPSRLAANPVSMSGNLWLDRSLASLRDQSRPPDEVVICVDPGQTERVPKRYFTDGWVRVVEAEQPGQAHALKAGVDATDGDMLMFLEDDDYLEREATELRLGIMQDTGVFLVSCSARETNEQGDYIRVNDFPTPSGWLLKRRVYEEAGGWDTSYKWHLDNAMLGRIRKLAPEGSDPRDMRIHIIESGAMETNVEQRKAWITAAAAFSVIAVSKVPRPLVNRTVHQLSGMAQIASSPDAGAESKAEMQRLIAEFGTVPW